MQQLTKHHVFPRRYYRRHNESVLMLCEKCHREIEALLPHNRKLHKDEYLAITSAWLLGAMISVPHRRRNAPRRARNIDLLAGTHERAEHASA